VRKRKRVIKRLLAYPALSLALLVASCGAQTVSNVLNLATIDLKHRVVTFSDLRGVGWTNVALVSANLDGIIFSTEGGGGMVSFTNLSPALLDRWGIPTNRITIARKRAMSRAAAWKSYSARANALAAVEHQQQADRAAKKLAAQTKQGAIDELQAKQNEIQQLVSAVAHDGAMRDNAWNRYVNNDFNNTSIVASSRGTYVTGENDAIRLSAAQSWDEQIDTDRQRLSDAQEEYREMMADYEKTYSAATNKAPTVIVSPATK
jgi:hypothetical protein